MNTNLEIDRTYQNMLAAAKARLIGKDPYNIAEKAGVIFDEKKSCYLVPSLGKEYAITYPDYDCAGKLENWHHLVILHYLDLADGALPYGKLTSFANLKDGLIRGSKFDVTVETELQKLLNGKSPEHVEAACKALGGKIKKSKADLCVELPCLPMYPVTVNVWFADEEYPAVGKMLLDESADHYLTVEDAVTVGGLILERLAENLKD